MSLKGKLEIYGLTDVGRKRSHNEDTVATDSSLGLAVIADGMGGYQAGEVASSIAVDIICKELSERLTQSSPGEVDEESGFTNESLAIRSAIEQANRIIYAASQREAKFAGMGTTVVTAAFYDDRITVAHVGDSRLYRLRGNEFHQVTADHSLLQELVDKGFYTKEEASQSLNKNYITRAIGIDAEVVPDVTEDVALKGDVYLLCSDGLTDGVNDEQIGEALRGAPKDLKGTAQRLVELANESGGRDNISVIVAHVVSSFGTRKSWYRKLLNWF